MAEHADKRILLIDDDFDVRDTLALMLTCAGFGVVQANNGAEGLQKALQERPDLIICDVKMPGMDGFQVLEKLKEHPDLRVVPFIFLSALTEVRESRTGMNLGADDYLTKPVTAANLLKAVRVRLARHEIFHRAMIDLGRLREILEAARNVAMVTFDPRDPEQRVLEFNSGAETIFGFSRGDILGKPLARLLPGNTEGQNFMERLLRFAGAASSVPAETSLFRKSGEAFSALVAVNPMTNSQGETIGMLWVTVDISDRKGIEEQLIQARRAAEAANQAKSDFLANISHEIRTPMNAVIGFTELLGKTPLSEKQLEYVTIACESAKNLMALIDSILDFSKIEAGKLELDVYPFSLQEIVNEVVQLFSVKAQEKKLTLVSQQIGAVSDNVLGDGERVRQILLNLVSNAIKFTEKGQVQVTARAEQLVPGTMEILLEVEDTGVGIAPEKMPLLFKKFSQVDSTTTRRFGGTGLGLAICRGLTEIMEGKITVRSGPQVGSIFSLALSLPLAKGEA